MAATRGIVDWPENLYLVHVPTWKAAEGRVCRDGSIDVWRLVWGPIERDMEGLFFLRPTFA